MSLKAQIKRVIPEPVRCGFRSSRRMYDDLPESVPWRLSETARRGRRLMRKLKDKHRGERCFIVGNGPSLNKMDLRPLRDENTFGLNRIYLLFDEIGFCTKYYVCVNQHVIRQCSAEIAAVPAPKFISWHSRNFIEPTDDMMFIRRGLEAEGFSKDITRCIYEGATVTFVAMQIAYYMGFSEVVLIGVDHNFKDKGEAHKLITSAGDDQNHFAPDYFGSGFQWQLPDLVASEEAYKLAKRNYEEDGRRIVDATVGGKLQVFPKVEYGSLV